MQSPHWKHDPEDQDYPAALSYLSLLLEPAAAAAVVDALKQVTEPSHFKAKDVLRASGLPLLAANDRHVAADLAKVAAGRKLSPVLLVRGVPLWIADGYHRVCASYHLEDNVDIPCRITARSQPPSAG